MDTATHFVIGLSLAGLAYVDPAVAASPTLAAAVLLGTVIGSQAPDFDGLLRFKSNALYVKNHRGITHSLPFLVIWTALISGILSLLFSGVPSGHIVLWTGIAVCLHVFSDLFNTYGTQAFRPVTEKWISWNIIHIFDPFIFTLHALAVLLWSTGAVHPAPLFTIVYILTVFYYIWRTGAHSMRTREVMRLDESRKPGERYFVIPTISYNKWHVVKSHPDGSYQIGVLNGHTLEWRKHAVTESHPAVEHSRKHPDVEAFLYFSSFAVAEVEPLPWGYVVRWADVRYRHRRQYPFVAVLVMDKNYQPINTYVGWLSSKKMNKRLSINSG
ncbi:inner membrane protein [Paenibacillus favisporus]|uniref:Inner membrane protein n=1 Tax=Paenibacillus favisporus TaxID=221028 RepID=A0ABV2FBK1_9BACL